MIGKIIGGAIGMAGGMPGVLAGMLLGHVFDSLFTSTGFNEGRQQSNRRQPISESDFTVSFIILSAAVMKADGRVLRSELNFVKDFLKRQFGQEHLQTNMDLLKATLDKRYDLNQICADIRHYMDKSSRGQLVYYLFQIANADGNIDENEERLIFRINASLGLSPSSFYSMRAMFGGRSHQTRGGGSSRNQHRTRTRPTTNHYAVLGVKATATDDEVKKAYRKLAKQYHPDKLRHLSKSHQDSGKEKFQKVQEAYETVKDLRGMK